MNDPVLELEVAWERHITHDRRLLDGLLARHREKHRRYHTAMHVTWVIRHVEDLAQAETVDHLDEVIAAAFYHDAIYEPTYPANERASARLARRDLAAIGWDEASVERVGAMIEATEHFASAREHPTGDGLTGDSSTGDSPTDAGPTIDSPTGDSSTGDTAVLLDADLAVLGADPAAYSAYVTGVRGEYRHLDDSEWRDSRAQVLQSFLDRSTIFATAGGRERWETRARANIESELATLT